MPGEEAHIPVVDIGRIISADSTIKDFQDVGREMVGGLDDCGFLYLKNHGVDKNALDSLTSDATLFFDLDEKVKVKYNKTDTIYGGYQGIGTECLVEEEQEKVFTEKTAPKDAHRETLDYNKCEPNAAFCNVTEVPSLNTTFSRYYEEMKKLTKVVMKALEHGLGLTQDALLNLHKSLMGDGTNNYTTCRILFYPGIDANTQLPEGSLRCGAHTDYGTFTFLFQDNVGGLEVLNNNDVWQSAMPMEGVAVFNLGDMFETFLAGKLTARKHRVVIPEDKEHRKLDRRSCTCFVVPDHDVIIRPCFPCPDGKYQATSILQHITRRVQISRHHVLNY